MTSYSFIDFCRRHDFCSLAKSKVLWGIIRALIFIIVVHSFLLVQCLDVTFNKNVCDPNEFFEPYVKVSKTRKGPIIKGIYETGFIDVRNLSGLICINGPAFVYMDNDGKNYVKPDIQVFSHGCVGFNRREMKEYKHPLKAIKSATKVYGPKIFGVYLLGDPADYRRSEFRWFRHPKYGYYENESSTDSINIGSSFGMIVSHGGKDGDGDVIESPPGPTAYCFALDTLSISGKIKADIASGDEPKFCYREEEDPEDEFDDCFHRSLMVSNYNWTECDTSDGDGDLDDSTPKPLPDFRIIDPAQLAPKGSPGKPWTPKVVVKDAAFVPFFSRPYPPGYYFKGEPGYQEPVTESITDETSITTTPKPVKKVQAEAKDCEDLPKVGTCDDVFNEEEACEILQHTLTISEVDWNSTELMPGNWRKDVLNLINKIYVKVCPQVSRGLAPAVTRIVEYFIEKVAKHAETKTADPAVTPGEKKFKNLNDAKRSQWDNHLIPDLERCLKFAEKMPFYRTRDLENEKKKKKVEKELEEMARGKGAGDTKELDATLKDVHIMFPYFIWLPPPDTWNNKTQIQIKEHIEAAEVDYDLDWAIDTFWKVFSTVLGYCNQHYRFRDGATFKLLYSLYTEDFLELISEQWTHEALVPEAKVYIFGNYEEVYEQIFGEFISGVASRYIEACNDGAYWAADVPDFRPPRPNYLKQGALKPGATYPVNFFIQHPLFHIDPLHLKKKK